MTDQTSPAPRPVSLVAVIAIFVLLSLFGVLAGRTYRHHKLAAPENEAPDHISKELAWRATPGDRRAYLAQMRKKQAEQGASYGWVDQKAGVVQLPIERAMELVVRENGAK